MSIAALLIALRARRVRLDTDGDALRVSAPAGELTLEIADAIAFHEPRLLTLPRPYITDTGELAIPCSAAPQYHWQPMAETLRELGASRVVWERYTSAPFIVVQ